MRTILYAVILTLIAGCTQSTTSTKLTSQAKITPIKRVPCITPHPTQPTLCTIEEHFFECIGEDGVIPAMDCVIYDYDGDGDVDIRDFWNFADRTFPCANCCLDFEAFECLGDHGTTVTGGCLHFDHDGDGDVDLKDLAAEICQSCSSCGG